MSVKLSVLVFGKTVGRAGCPITQRLVVQFLFYLLLCLFVQQCLTKMEVDVVWAALLLSVCQSQFIIIIKPEF